MNNAETIANIKDTTPILTNSEKAWLAYLEVRFGLKNKNADFLKV